MNAKLILPYLVAFVLAWGCSAPGAERRPGALVEVFRDGQKPSKAFKEIGMLTDDGGLGEQGTIEGKFLRKAKRMGANAIIMYPLQKTGAELKGFSLVDTFLYKASVVVYE
jgi:hypothetical protein